MQVELTDYGVDHPQYFPGHGCAFSDFDHSALGIGGTFADAIESAIDAACESDDSLTYDEIRTEIKLTYPDAIGTDGKWLADVSASAEARSQTDDDSDDSDDSELYYHVGLRW